MRLETRRRPALVGRLARHRQAVLACAVAAPVAAGLGGLMLLVHLLPSMLPALVAGLDAVPGPSWLLACALLLGAFAPLPVGCGEDRGPAPSQAALSSMFAIALVATGPLLLVLLASLLAVVVGEVRRAARARRPAVAIGRHLVAVVLARTVFCLLTGSALLAPYRAITPDHLAACLAAGLAYLLVDLAPTLLGQGADLRSVSWLRDDLLPRLEVRAVLCGLAPVAAVLAETDPWLLPFVALPVLVVRRSASLAAVQRARALRDPLTGLGNREMFLSCADGLVARRERTDEPLAVLMVDLDHFKDINDTLGHQVGDQVIQAVGRRLAQAGGRHGCVARLGGDEFALAVPGINPEESGVFAQGLLADLARPLQIGGTRMVMQASVGIAMADAQTDLALLVQRADSALYLAKQDRARWCRYDPSSTVDDAPRRLDLITDLRAALDQQALGVRFEPQVSLTSGQVTAVAAQVHWVHPVHGPVPVSDVLAAADLAGLTDAVADVVLGQALGTAARWMAAGSTCPVVVTVPDRQLADLDLPDRLRQALAGHRVPAGLLTVQVSDRGLRGRPTRAARILRDLRQHGVRVCLAGFGTGQCDLGSLRGLHLDELTVDRTFVAALDAVPRDAGRPAGARDAGPRADVRPDGAVPGGRDLLARTVIELGHRLGLTMVATGVHRSQQLDALRALGCESAHGPVVAPWMDAAELLQWLSGASSRPPTVIDLDAWSTPAPPAGRPG